MEIATIFRRPDEYRGSINWTAVSIPQSFREFTDFNVNPCLTALPVINQCSITVCEILNMNRVDLLLSAFKLRHDDLYSLFI